MEVVPGPYGYLVQANPPTEEELSARYLEPYWGDPEHVRYLKAEAADIQYWNTIFDDVLDVILKFDARPTVVDVGCGQGLLIRRFRRRNIVSYGVDPYAGMTPDIVGNFPDVATNLPRLYPTCLTAFNVLEHVLDPEMFVTTAYHLLPPGGLIILQVPYEENKLQKRLTARYGPWWHDEDHINYFVGDSLRRLLVGVGFEIVEEWRTFPMELFVLLGFNYIDNPGLGQRCHGARMHVEKAVGSLGRRLLRKLWVKLDVGREQILFARK